MNSILSSIKKMLGLDESYEHFDIDVLTCINSAFMSLTQLGIGNQNGFMVNSKLETWTDFIGDRLDLEAVKTFTFLKVRLMFDPPTNSFMIESMNRQISEIEWRILQVVENTSTPDL